jgi:hypothetical protein
MVDEFNDWLVGNGHKPWPKETFSSRFLAHTTTKGLHVGKAQTKKLDGLSRRFAFVENSQRGTPERATVFYNVRFRDGSD